MGLHYVVAVLVVDDDNGERDPDVVAESLLDGLASLEPKGLGGYGLLAQTSASPASPEWAFRDQILSVTVAGHVVDSTPAFIVERKTA